MKFIGYVFFRSSTEGATGPPGETEILALNPQRRTAILKATGWTGLEPGSLNLKVDSSVVIALGDYKSTFSESWTDVKYPPPYAGIPQLRIGYLYYKCVAHMGDDRQDCLVRRAINPLPDRVELFSSVSLKSKWALDEGALLTVNIP